MLKWDGSVLILWVIIYDTSSHVCNHVSYHGMVMEEGKPFLSGRGAGVQNVKSVLPLKRLLKIPIFGFLLGVTSTNAPTLISCLFGGGIGSGSLLKSFAADLTMTGPAILFRSILLSMIDWTNYAIRNVMHALHKKNGRTNGWSKEICLSATNAYCALSRRLHWT